MSNIKTYLRIVATTLYYIILICIGALTLYAIILLCVKQIHKNSVITMNALGSICTHTDYKHACITTMSSVVHNRTATLIDIPTTAISAIIHSVTFAQSSFITSSIATANNGTLDDCTELLEYALDELRASSAIVAESNLETIYNKEADLMSSLSAVAAYQQTCLDGFNQLYPSKQMMVADIFRNATQLTSNALAIIAALPNIFKELDMSATTRRGGGRRLLGSEKNGYPWWLSAADRRLLAGGNAILTPNAVVAKDGSGQFKTIMEALAAYPKGNTKRYIVYVKEGIYDEYVTVTKEKVNVFMYGDGPRKTIVTGNKSHKTGWTTFKSASFSAIGRGFIAKSMGFRNTAGPEAEQAVALRSQSDKSAFYDVEISGYQDTLYTHTHRQFYSNCTISGTVDFIFGDGSVVIQNCLIICKLPATGQKNTITAQGRKLPHETTGLVIQNCRITADERLFPVRFEVESYLGRPWREYSRTVVMESTVEDLIQAEGWLPWRGRFGLDTCFYGECGNVGPGAGVDKRVRWKGFKVIRDRSEAMEFTVGGFIQGNDWLKETGAPFYLGLTGAP